MCVCACAIDRKINILRHSHDTKGPLIAKRIDQWHKHLSFVSVSDVVKTCRYLGVHLDDRLD